MPSEAAPRFGSPDLKLPEELREGRSWAHLDYLPNRYLAHETGRDAWGSVAARRLIVIDMAKFWLMPQEQIGADLSFVLEHTCVACWRRRELPASPCCSSRRSPSIPPLRLQSAKQETVRELSGGRRTFVRSSTPGWVGETRQEKIVRKRYASAFKGTNLHEMLTSLEIDTLIVTGISTSHCVYATCRDATDSFRVIVPQEAVGERCELFHEVNLLDIDIDLGDVMPVDEVVASLKTLPRRPDPG